MKNLFRTLVLVLTMTALSSTAPACSGTTPSSSVTAQQDARVTVEGLAVAWVAAEKACVAAATAAKNDTIRSQCAAYLTPARDGIIAAAEGVDAWSSANQQMYPCLVAHVAVALVEASNVLLAFNVQVPSIVMQAIRLATGASILCQEPTSDAGVE